MIFPRVLIQRCIIYQIRNSLKYVRWRERKEFATDFKTVYTAINREAGELALLGVADKWSKQYPMAVKCWESNWEDPISQLQMAYLRTRTTYNFHFSEWFYT